MELLGIFLVAVLVVVLLFLYFMYLTSPKSTKKGRYNDPCIRRSDVGPKWAEIQAMMRAGGPANFKQSIFEADKLVDAVLVGKVKGDTMGERLKNAKHLFSQNTYNDLWTAHKVRNRLAHDADFEGLSSEAVMAVRNFEKALRELRAI